MSKDCGDADADDGGRDGGIGGLLYTPSEVSCLPGLAIGGARL